MALTGFGLPIYLWRFLKTHKEEFATKGAHGNGVALSAIQEEEEDDVTDGSVHYLNGSTVSNKVCNGLADEQEVHASISAITF